MAQNTRRDPRAKVLSMTVRYRSATLGEFIEHHSYDVSRGGMFIKTPSPFPAGTLLKFEVKIAEEQRVMQGVGRVVWKRDTPVAETDEPAGMGIKFIKIDDGSRAVIERLLESRGGGTLGAFDRSPEQPTSGMFPGSEHLDLPAPEDRTVMKPASELLEEALRKTAADGAPASGRQMSAASARGGFEPVRATPQSFAPPSYEADEGESEPPPPSARRIPSLESLNRTQRSPLERSADSAAKPRQASIPARPPEADEEGGGGRALFLFVAVAAVAVGIWFLTKRGGQTEPTLDLGAEAVKAPPAVPPPALSAKEPEAVPPPEPEASEPGAAASAAPTSEPAPTAAPAVTTAPAATVAPVAPVVKKPKPVVVAPVATAAPSATNATAPAPSATGTPKPTPAPTAAPAVKPEDINPY